jgi:hypothetical protein
VRTTGGKGQAEELAQAATDITRNGKLVSTHIVWVCGRTTNGGLGLVWLGLGPLAASIGVSEGKQMVRPFERGVDSVTVGFFVLCQVWSSISQVINN